MTDTIKILVVDDEKDILEFLSYNLQKEDFMVTTADNGHKAIELAKKFHPHLILLDVMMPEMDGIETCEKLRSFPDLKNTLIAFLTARGEDYSHIAGFEAGGDDYITKPIKPKVLVSRLKALLRRTTRVSESDIKNMEELSTGDLKIDKEKYIVYVNEKELFLPKKEFELLTFLTSKPNRLFSREEIFHHIWGSETIVGDRTLDVHIRKLRSKIGDYYIKTVKGVGYKFTP